MRAWSLLVLCLLLAPSASRGAERVPKLVVLGIRPIDPSDRKSAESLTEVLTTDLAKSRRFEVLSESELGSLLGFEKQKQILSCSDAGCLAEAGGALGCELLLLGALGRVGGRISLDLKLADVKRGKIICRQGAQVRSADELLNAGRAVLHDLLVELSGGAPAVPIEPAALVEVKEESPGPGYGPYLAMGVGGAAAIGGGVLAGVTLTNKGSYKYDDARANTSAGFILGGVGLAVVAAGAIWAIVRTTGTSDSAPAASTQFGIAPAPGGAAICAAGSF